MFPLSDAPNPPRTPWVTYALILLNVLVFVGWTLPLSMERPAPGDPRVDAYLRVVAESLPPNVPLREVVASISLYDLFVFEHGYKPGAPELTDLMAAMFLHGGFMHLFGNMLFLWIYGDNVEHRLGRFWYLVAYLATGIAATLFFAVLSPGSLIPMVGASGAISGVLGFYFLWFPHNVVRVLVLLFPIFMRVIEVPARIVLGLYLFMDNVVPLLVGGSSGGGVAYGAHIGGFVAGVAAAWVLSRRTVEATPAEYRSAVREVPDPSRAAAAAIASGDMETAARAYFALSPQDARTALAPDEAVALAGWLGDHGHPQAAITVYERLVRQHPHGPSAAEAHVGAGTVLLRDLAQPTLAYQHFVDALRTTHDETIAARARAGLAAIVSAQKFPARRFSGSGA